MGHSILGQSALGTKGKGKGYATKGKGDATSGKSKSDATKGNRKFVEQTLGNRGAQLLWTHDTEMT